MFGQKGWSYHLFKYLLLFITVFTTRHREKLQKEKLQGEELQGDIPKSHSCVCAHCGRRFPGEDEIGEDEIGYSITSPGVDTDLESEDNS